MGEENFKNRGELVFETLKREILDLRLKPGQMISENDICDRFGVSSEGCPQAFAGTGLCGDRSLQGDLCHSFKPG